MEAVQGRARPIGEVVGLYFVTVGIYWFVWIYQAFKELGDALGRQIRHGAWVGAIAFLTSVGPVYLVALSVRGLVEDVAQGSPERLRGLLGLQDLFLSRYDWSDPWQFAVAAITGAGLGIQLAYLVKVQGLLRAAGSEGIRAPGLGVPLLFTGLGLAGLLPKLGWATWVAFLVQPVWLGSVQSFLNRVWARAGEARWQVVDAPPDVPGPP